MASQYLQSSYIYSAGSKGASNSNSYAALVKKTESQGLVSQNASMNPIGETSHLNSVAAKYRYYTDKYGTYAKPVEPAKPILPDGFKATADEISKLPKSQQDFFNAGTPIKAQYATYGQYIQDQIKAGNTRPNG